METFYKVYLERLEDLHNQIESVLEELPQESLDWTPVDDMPSICVLVTHLTGAERYWIGDVAGDDPSNRDRDAEFRAQHESAAALQKRLKTSFSYAQQLLQSFVVSDLDSIGTSARDSRQFTTAWALLHALEHTAIHLGHIQIIRQLWDQGQN